MRGRRPHLVDYLHRRRAIRSPAATSSSNSTGTADSTSNCGSSSYYDLTGEPDRDRHPRLTDGSGSAFIGERTDRPASSLETVAAVALGDYAVDLRDDPPADFRTDFAASLEDVVTDRYAPLARTDDGQPALAANSDAY